MPKIYKYASAETGLSILKNRNVAVNNPNNFNDLFDTDLLAKDKDVKKGLQLYADYLLENEFLEKAKKVIRSGNEKDKKICQRFVCNIEKRRKHGLKTKRYYPTITVKSLELLTKIFGFLLPKEKRESAKQSFLQIDHTIKDNGIIEIKDLINELPNTVRASCFSERGDIVKMWSHYANKSKGICLEYEDVKSVYKMKYVKNQKCLKFYDFVSIFIAFCIDSKINLSEKEIINYSLLLNKSKDWAEEKEIRLLIPSTDRLISKIIVDGKEMEVYPIGKPTKVILGAKISEENKHIISEYCKNNGIKMSVCKKKNYRIVLEDYSQ